MFILTKEFAFDASHQLPYYEGKCARLHGHRWRLVVYLAGDRLQEMGPQAGMLIDFNEVKRRVQPLLDTHLDHHHLNNFHENPTCEQLARQCFHLLKECLPNLMAVRLFETPTSSVLYSPIESSEILSILALS